MTRDLRALKRDSVQELPTVTTLVSDQPQPVLVIGGSRGTGFLIARLLHEKDMPVRVLARDAERASAKLGRFIEVMSGDITQRDTLNSAVAGVAHIVFTAGVRSGHLSGEAQIRATDYQGVVNTLAAARNAGFAGRFLYMNTIGINTPSLSGWLLNLTKVNVLRWRRRAEEEIRSSGIDYTIIRTGFLLNGAAGKHAIDLTQNALPLSPRYRIARADVAAAFVTAIRHPRASRATFELAWKRGRAQEDWNVLLGGLKAD